jgi:hypothetical protein
MKETLVAGWESYEESSRLVLSAIGLALDFQAWRAMVRTQGLSDEQAIELMVGMVRCAAGVVEPRYLPTGTEYPELLRILLPRTLVNKPVHTSKYLLATTSSD